MFQAHQDPPVVAVPDIDAARPFISALEVRRDLTLTVLRPDAVAEALHSGACACALVSPAALLQDPTLSVIPGAGIASRGATPSEQLRTAKPLNQIRSIAVDPASRHLEAYVRILFAEKGLDAPQFRADAAPEYADATLVSGAERSCEHKPAAAHDLGEWWMEATGLPMVLWVWACGPLAPHRMLRQVLGEAARQGEEPHEGGRADETPAPVSGYAYQILSRESDSIRDLHERARRHAIFETIVESIAFC